MTHNIRSSAPLRSRAPFYRHQTASSWLCSESTEFLTQSLLPHMPCLQYCFSLHLMQCLVT